MCKSRNSKLHGSAEMQAKKSICAASLTSRQEVVQAGMLLYKTATNPCCFPVVIVPVLVLCVNQRRQVCAASDTPIQLTH